MDILKQIDFVQQFAKEYADGAWSIDVEKWKHHVTPEFIENIRQYIVSLQMKLMHEQTAQAKPFTYLWEADGTCEAVRACNKHRQDRTRWMESYPHITQAAPTEAQERRSLRRNSISFAKLFHLRHDGSAIVQGSFEAGRAGRKV